ncbi:MAG TPA: hypothetical protein VMF61_12085 [Candidatus Acidoferrales bacterium]|nr:hypothetical protein [Candidatus Acidoferrales bacterium]
MNQVRATGVAAFFLGIGLAGEPLDPIGMLIAAALLFVLVLALERPGTNLQTFVVGLAGVLLASIVQHAGVFEPAFRPIAIATRLYFGLYPGTLVVGFGLALLATASNGRPRAPIAIAVLGCLVGIALFFLL